MKRLVLLLIFALLAGPVAAADTVKISADKFDIDEAAHQAVFTGNVEVEHPMMKLTAETVTVHYGAGGTTDITSFDASGKVKIKIGEQTATGQTAVYDPVGQVLRLSGKVKVSGGGSMVSGGDFVINLVTNTSTFGGGGDGGRVTGFFSPQ